MFKILVVDDYDLTLKTITRIISEFLKTEHQIETAMNGEDAWLKIKENQPNIVLTDLRMPIMNGLDLTMRIKSEYPQIPVILMTGTAQDIPVDFPSDDIITKPFQPNELIEAIMFQHNLTHTIVIV